LIQPDWSRDLRETPLQGAEKMEFHGRPGAVSYGHDIGILMLDCFCAFVPGDVGNAYTYSYPVLYHMVPGLSSPIVHAGGKEVTDRLLEAARYLESQGVKAITSDCGYMLHYQDIVSAAVNVPVMLSPLLQLPFVASTLRNDQSIGILCANDKGLSQALIDTAFPHPTRDVHVRGMNDKKAFWKAFIEDVGYLDMSAVEAEMTEAARDLVQRHPDIGAIVMECSNMPPYAHLVHQVTGKPVFDFVTMINHLRAALSPRPFSGGY
jgi:hypothetical protein